MEFKEEAVLAFEQPQPAAFLDRKQQPADKLAKTHRPGKVTKRAATDKKCTSCGTTSTPVWRWGGETKEVLLCNACSLRIRRSASRPRAKSPNEQLATASQRHSPASTSTDSGPPHHNQQPDAALAELPPSEAEALRLNLLECVEFHLGLERARLLGPREVASMEHEWYAMHAAQRLQAFNNSVMAMAGPMQRGGAPVQYARDWHPQHRAPGMMADAARYEFSMAQSSQPYSRHEAGLLHMQ